MRKLNLFETCKEFKRKLVRGEVSKILVDSNNLLTAPLQLYTIYIYTFKYTSIFRYRYRYIDIDI